MSCRSRHLWKQINIKRWLIISTLLFFGIMATYVVFRVVMGKRPAIVTHFPSVGGFDPAPRNEIKFSFGNYNNRANDYVAIDQSTADSVRTFLEQSTSCSVRLLNN